MPVHPYTHHWQFNYEKVLFSIREECHIRIVRNQFFKSVSEKLKALWRTNWPNLPMTIQSSSIIPLTPFCKPHQQPWVRYHFSIILTSGFRVMPWWHDVSVSNWQSWGEQWSQEGKESWHWSLATHRAFVRQVGVMNCMGWFGFNLNLGQAVHSTSLPLQARLPATIQAVSWKKLRPGWFFGMQHAELMTSFSCPIVSTLACKCLIDLWQQWTCLFFSPTPQKNEHSTWKKALKTEDYFPLVLPAWLHPNAVFMGCLCRFDATACQVPRCRHTAFPFFPSRISVAWRPSSCWTSLQSIQFIKWYF